MRRLLRGVRPGAHRPVPIEAHRREDECFQHFLLPRQRPRPGSTTRQGAVNRRCPRGREAEERHRRKAPGNATDVASEGKERSDAVRAQGAPATRVREARRPSAARVERGDRRGVGRADRRARFHAAKRNGNAARRHLPLCPFLFLPRIRSFSGGSGSYFLVHQRKKDDSTPSLTP
jgi:hypothetical protein